MRFRSPGSSGSPPSKRVKLEQDDSTPRLTFVDPDVAGGGDYGVKLEPQEHVQITKPLDTTNEQIIAEEQEEEDEEEDDENNCSICLQSIVDRTVIPNCSHEFCFECVQVWTEQSRRCPLCSQTISSYLIHHIRSKYDFQKYYLPPLRKSPSPLPGARALESTRRNAMARRRRREREWGRGQREREEREDEMDRLEVSIEKRKWVYRCDLYAKHVASNAFTKYRPYPTPAQFAGSQELISRTTTFLRRELQVWNGLDVEFLTTLIISLMKSIDIRSESAVKLISEFLDMDEPYEPGGRHRNAEHFAHEVYCYVRSPYKDLFVYDTVVQYDTPPDMPQPPQQRHRARRWRRGEHEREERGSGREREDPSGPVDHPNQTRETEAQSSYGPRRPPSAERKHESRTRGRVRTRSRKRSREREASISWSPSGRTYPSTRFTSNQHSSDAAVNHPRSSSRRRRSRGRHSGAHTRSPSPRYHHTVTSAQGGDLRGTRERVNGYWSANRRDETDDGHPRSSHVGPDQNSHPSHEARKEVGKEPLNWTVKRERKNSSEVERKRDRADGAWTRNASGGRVLTDDDVASADGARAHDGGHRDEMDLKGKGKEKETDTKRESRRRSEDQEFEDQTEWKEKRRRRNSDVDDTHGKDDLEYYRAGQPSHRILDEEESSPTPPSVPNPPPAGHSSLGMTTMLNSTTTTTDSSRLPRNRTLRDSVQAHLAGSVTGRYRDTLKLEGGGGGAGIVDKREVDAQAHLPADTLSRIGESQDPSGQRPSVYISPDHSIPSLLDRISDPQPSKRSERLENVVTEKRVQTQSLDNTTVKSTAARVPSGVSHREAQDDGHTKAKSRVSVPKAIFGHLARNNKTAASNDSAGTSRHTTISREKEIRQQRVSSSSPLNTGHQDTPLQQHRPREAPSGPQIQSLTSDNADNVNVTSGDNSIGITAGVDAADSIPLTDFSHSTSESTEADTHACAARASRRARFGEASLCGSVSLSGSDNIATEIPSRQASSQFESDSPVSGNADNHVIHPSHPPAITDTPIQAKGPPKSVLNSGSSIYEQNLSSEAREQHMRLLLKLKKEKKAHEYSRELVENPSRTLRSSSFSEEAAAVTSLPLLPESSGMSKLDRTSRRFDSTRRSSNDENGHDLDLASGIVEDKGLIREARLRARAQLQVRLAAEKRAGGMA